jgi:hypothetical protein
VWREQASSVEACVISTSDDGRHIIADHKLTLIGIDSHDEAFYLSGLLNSVPVRSVVKAYSIEIQISTHVCAFVNLPRFEKGNTLHKQIARVASECHDVARKGDQDRLVQLEGNLDRLAAQLWLLNATELEALKVCGERAVRAKAKADTVDDSQEE